MDKLNFCEAKNLVKRVASATSGAKAYISNGMLAESCVESVDGMPKRAPYKKFGFGFIDESPDKPWIHNCKYVFINEYGLHCIKKESQPPVLWDSLEEII